MLFTLRVNRAGYVGPRLSLYRAAALLSLAAIIALGALLRFWNLGEPSLWADEIASVSFGRAPADLLWSDWMVYETNPPLYYSLLNGWMDVFGEGEFAVRAMSVVFGLAAIAAVFMFTRALHSTFAGLCTAVFCALSAEQLGYVALALWAWWAWITVLQIQTGAETVSWIPKPAIFDTIAIVSHVVATRSFEIANVLIAGVFGAVMAWGWWKLPLEGRVLALVFGAGVPLVCWASAWRVRSFWSARYFGCSSSISLF